ncbi:MAG: 16S rRNA (cytosine(1402)-N(4))-methyltransferase [Draconibacterium sp.]|nr:MAG: 16S rRNA (cytosine(1402)-N(4))-methyltransferase [Draconibacterium sp.]
MTGSYHIPVMPIESIEGLNLHSGADVVDATFGGAGHSRLILDKLGDGRLFAFDQDLDATENVFPDPRLFFVRHNFRYITNFLRYYGVSSVDAIFADLGVSSHDFDVAGRGFSFRFNGDLDMRMNRNSELTAADVVNDYSEEDLSHLFRLYGEIKNAGRLAAHLVKKRAATSIRFTGQLREIATECAPKGMENKYLAQVFQAVRIEVNDEMEALKVFLSASLKLLKPAGRLVVITYHSLEDRICKNFMKSGNFEGKITKDFYGNPQLPFRLVNRKVITPTSDEMKANSRSRSAKLRIAEKI